VRAHGVPFSLVAIVLTALIVALIVFYVYNDWILVAVALLLLMVLALMLRTIWVIDSFKPRRHRESEWVKQEIKTSINKEALLLAMSLRKDKQTWRPRIP